MVPVVWGAHREDYLLAAPPHSFLFAPDFSSPAALGRELARLAAEPALYALFFEWRRLGRVEMDFGFACKLCALAYVEQHRRRVSDRHQLHHHEDHQLHNQLHSPLHLRREEAGYVFRYDAARAQFVEEEKAEAVGGAETAPGLQEHPLSNLLVPTHSQTQSQRHRRGGVGGGARTLADVVREGHQSWHVEFEVDYAQGASRVDGAESPQQRVLRPAQMLDWWRLEYDNSGTHSRPICRPDWTT